MVQEQDERIPAETGQMAKTVGQVQDQLTNLAQLIERSRIAEYAEIMVKPWRLIWLNMLAGASKGVGLAIGFSVFAAILLSLLRWLNVLNLPIFGDYIADLVRIVQRQLEGKPY